MCKLRAANMTRWLVRKSVFVLNGLWFVNRFRGRGLGPEFESQLALLRFPLYDTLEKFEWFTDVESCFYS